MTPCFTNHKITSRKTELNRFFRSMKEEGLIVSRLIRLYSLALIGSLSQYLDANACRALWQTFPQRTGPPP